MSDQTKKNNLNITAFRRAVLDWYDHHGRELPWRVKKPMAYAIWLSEIMMQQTTIQMGTPYYLKFLTLWPTVHDLAAAPIEDVLKHWAGLGYYARARNLHKCANIIVNDYGGKFPDTADALQKLPGIGPYTAAAMAAIVFNKPATVVDGNVERVMARVFNIQTPLPMGKKDMIAAAHYLSDEQKHRSGDYAQAMMDLGAMICTPRAPKCALCPVSKFCAAFKKGNHETLPMRSPKKTKPKKFGFVYVIKNSQGHVMLQTRPDTGLFGGMMGLPTSDWLTDKKSISHIALLENMPMEIKKDSDVRHIFTHFDLTLTPVAIDWKGRIPKGMMWVDAKNVAELGLPTLFAKVLKLMK